MFGLRALARTMLSAIFVVGATSAWKRADLLAEKSQRVTKPIASATGGTLTPEDLVKVNAVVQVSAAGLFALGIFPRVMAIVLGVSLVPTTMVGHAYWEISDEPDRTQQKIHFLKNAGLIGGLMFAALDTGGSPSVFWSGRKAALGFKDTLASASHSVLDIADR